MSGDRGEGQKQKRRSRCRGTVAVTGLPSHRPPSRPLPRPPPPASPRSCCRDMRAWLIEGAKTTKEKKTGKLETEAEKNTEAAEKRKSQPLVSNRHQNRHQHHCQLLYPSSSSQVTLPLIPYSSSCMQNVHCARSASKKLISWLLCTVTS